MTHVMAYFMTHVTIFFVTHVMVYFMTHVMAYFLTRHELLHDSCHGLPDTLPQPALFLSSVVALISSNTKLIL